MTSQVKGFFGLQLASQKMQVLFQVDSKLLTKIGNCRNIILDWFLYLERILIAGQLYFVGVSLKVVLSEGKARNEDKLLLVLVFGVRVTNLVKKSLPISLG